jgi:hypothetical protein
MSRDSEETWAAAFGCLIVGLILTMKLAFWSLLIWGVIEGALWLGRN